MVCIYLSISGYVMYYVRMFVYVIGVKVAQWLEIGVCVVLAVCDCDVR